MAAILNAIFGTFSQSEEQNLSTNTNSSVTEQSAVNNECLRTSAVADNVQIKSVISSETQANATVNTKLNIDSLLAQLSTTHAQVDQYSRTRTAEINEQVQKSIADVLGTTQHQQEELLANANQRHLIVENDYKIQLQKAIEALDTDKAKQLADLEHYLQAKQQLIMNEAKKQIDILNDEANKAKLDLLIEVQVEDKVNIDNLADQIGAIGQQETHHLLQSTTTTVITSQAQGTTNAQTVMTTETIDATTAHNQSQVAIKSSSYSSAELASISTPPTTTQGNTTTVDTITRASNLTTKSINPIATAANVTLNSKDIDSIIANASLRSKKMTVQPAATSTGATSNNNIVNPVVAAANIALDSNVVESIVTNASARSKKKTVEPAATSTGVTSNNNTIEAEIKSPKDNTTF